MRASSYAETSPRQGNPIPLTLVWDSSRAHSAQMPKVVASSHGESSEARDVAGAFDELRKELNAATGRLLKAEATAFDTLVWCMDSEPVEDGAIHPAEKALEAFLSEYGGLAVLVHWMALDASRAASLLRLLGRSKKVERNARHAAVSHGLASASVEVRDAAAQAAELWEDAEVVPLLLKHRDPTPWLAKYVEHVANSMAR